MHSKLSGCVLLGVLLGAFVGTVQGCGSEPFDFPCEPAFPCREPDICVDGLCVLPDAGTDASDAGETSAIGCTGPCIPRGPDGWSDPRAVWIGDASKAPTFCPENMDMGLRTRAFADLEWEYGTCEPCGCTAPTGTCTTLPETIEVRAALCAQQGTALPFGGPDGWDGSCTNANAIPAGAMCGGTLCAQSLAVSPLGPPVEDGCEPVVIPAEKPPHAGTPTMSGPTWTWKTHAISCYLPTCEDPKEACMRTLAPLPEGFAHCVSLSGFHACPETWNAKELVAYDDDKAGAIDGRACTACECGAPAGGACLARVRTFEDGACAKLISDDAISSSVEQCSNVSIAGLAIGSKEITPPEYIPGACATSGGEPTGAVVPNPDRATTFCCRALDA
ncbi:hypothetical protein [Polyangium spumosum]|uniref:Uncharacterized protein n=1 Tax=Polyangium spumosum TaxID=889282 RepID=A0A6N7PSD2_9BACT|nr:hypothetical protein [Polyangium spumosum]MRG94557.1 hypothetical protein [Polyangium spumosum]